MRAIIQRVKSAEVRVDSMAIGRCGPGFLLYVAAHRDDTNSDAEKLAEKVSTLRLLADPDGKMNLALGDLPESDEPQVLAISNFTLYGDASKQRRPSFMESAPYERGQVLFDHFVAKLKSLQIRTEVGEFGAHMEVESINDGPVTLVLDVGPSQPTA